MRPKKKNLSKEALMGDFNYEAGWVCIQINIAREWLTLLQLQESRQNGE